MSAAPELIPVPIQAKRPKSPSLVAVTLDVSGTPLEEAHRFAGQYIQLKVDDLGPTYLALASAPGDGAFELLVKRGGEVSDALLALGPGAEVHVSAPLGHGFGVEAHEGRDVLLFAGGSGISAIRSVLLRILAHRDRYGRVLLFFGARTPDELVYSDEIARWEAEGVEVFPVVSRPDGARWEGRRGHVQQALAEVAPPVDNAVACLCGVKGMHTEVADLLTGRGLPADRVLTNF